MTCYNCKFENGEWYETWEDAYYTYGCDLGNDCEEVEINGTCKDFEEI